MQVTPPPSMPPLFATMTKAQANLLKTIQDTVEDHTPLDAGAVEEWARVMKVIGQTDRRMLFQPTQSAKVKDQIGQLCKMIEEDAGGFGAQLTWMRCRLK